MNLGDKLSIQQSITPGIKHNKVKDKGILLIITERFSFVLKAKR